MADWVSLHTVEHVLRGDLDVTSASIACVLVGPDMALTNEDEFLSSATLDEPSVSGYSSGHGNSGRLRLSTITGAQDWANSEFEWSAATFGWTLATGFTVNGVVLAVTGTTGDTDARVIRFIDLTNTPTNGGRIGVTPGTFLKSTYS